MKTFSVLSISRSILTAAAFIAILLTTSILTQNSGVDTSFIPSLTKDITSDVSGNPVIQPDGKIIIFGNIVNGSGTGTAAYLRRLNADGTPDPTFNCAVCETVQITTLIVQPDGKIILAGSNTIRLNPDGSQDLTFNVSFTSPTGNGYSSDVYLVQPDGKIIVQYTYSAQGFRGHEFHRLNPNGSDDTSFTPIVFRLSRNPIDVAKVLVLANGKVLIGGTAFVATTATAFLQRYNADGTSDTGFEQPIIDDLDDRRPFLTDFDVYPDGSLLLYF
jgi:uncharacterized delta-60 repeat protein